VITLLSTLVSFLAGGLPKILDFFQDSSDKKQELAMMQMQMQMQMDMAKMGMAAQVAVEEIKTEQQIISAQARQQEAMYAHDIAIGQGASQWVTNLRASVRPIITYCMFGMLAFINIFGCWYAVQQGTDFSVALNLLWDDETQILFASVISFWFGSQAFGRK